MKHLVLKEDDHVGSGKMPFFRYSKVTALQWCLSVAAIVYGGVKYKEE